MFPVPKYRLDPEKEFSGLFAHAFDRAHIQLW
jgi:hypothetical protein